MVAVTLPHQLAHRLRGLGARAERRETAPARFAGG